MKHILIYIQFRFYPNEFVTNLFLKLLDFTTFSVEFGIEHKGFGGL